MNHLAQRLLQGTAPLPLTEADLAAILRNRVLTAIHDAAEMGLSPEDILRQLEMLVKYKSSTAYKDKDVPGPPSRQDLKQRSREADVRQKQYSAARVP